MVIELACLESERVKITANPCDAQGNPIPVGSTLSVQIVAGTGTVQAVGGDDMSKYLLPGVADPTDTTYLAEVDSDVGAGVAKIQQVIVLHVRPARAVSLGIVTSKPEDQP